jgi:hypothetical protein
MVGEGMVTLGVRPGAHLALQVFEVGALDVLGMAHLVDHAHRRRRQFLGAVGLTDGDRDVGLHAAQLVQEIDVEVGAAELSVGDALQAHVLLELDDLGDGASSTVRSCSGVMAPLAFWARASSR